MVCLLLVGTDFVCGKSLSGIYIMHSGESNRKEKSLALLTQNFLKLFLCTDVSCTNTLTICKDLNLPTSSVCNVQSFFSDGDGLPG